MSSFCKAVGHQAVGEPLEVATILDWPLPEPGPGDALVKIHYAPISPADLNLLEGRYGIKATLPAVGGNEGVGYVEKLGAASENLHLKIGQPVILPLGGGTWREQMVLPARELFPLPQEIEPTQASMMGVNPPTALLMLEKFVELKAGDWVVQNAANSGVGRCVIQIAKARGLRTINFLRRMELADELKSLGADLVFEDKPGSDKKALEQIGDAPVQLALNGIGGLSALRLSKILAPHGYHITYGGMSKEPLTITTGQLIFKDLRFQGFWLTEWKKKASREEINKAFGTLAGMIVDGTLKQPIAKIFPFTAYREALAMAMQSGRDGKVLLKFVP